MSDFSIRYHGLTHLKEIPTQNNVKLSVRNELRWDAATEEKRDEVNFLAIKGQGVRFGAPVAVDWAFPADNELPVLLDAFVRHVDVTQQSRRLLRDFQELVITCEPRPWLVLGWVFSDAGAHGYATFRKDDTTITATFAHSDAFAVIRNELG